MSGSKPSVITFVVRALIVITLLTLAGVFAFDDYGGFIRLRQERLKLLDEPTPGSHSVLFVGNSHTYTHDIPFVVQRLAAADLAGSDIFVDMAAASNVPLTYHYVAGSRALDLAASRDWDTIVLQNHSTTPTDPKRYAVEFDEAVKAFSPHARRLVLYQTWAWASDDPYFYGDPVRYRRMEALVSETYAEALRAHPEVDGAPVGEAFSRIRRDLGVRLTRPDGNHTNSEGALVASCVLYSTLTSRRCPEVDDLLDVRVDSGVAADLRAALID